MFNFLKSKKKFIFTDAAGNIIGRSANPNVSISGAEKTEVFDIIEYNGRIIKNKKFNELRIAVISVYNTHCGISTYSEYLINELKPLVGDLKVFSEASTTLTRSDESFVTRCYKRDDSVYSELMKEISNYKPDVVFLHDDNNISSNEFAYNSLLTFLQNYISFIVIHNVRPNRNYPVNSDINFIVHTEEAKKKLESLASKKVRCFVIPHGCVFYSQRQTRKLENSVIHFGFGFPYKGWEQALKAVAELKKEIPDVKFYGVFSENPNQTAIHNAYYKTIESLINKLNLRDNVAIERGFIKEDILLNKLRQHSVCIFPYTENINNPLGTSGAARIAIGSGIPIIVSDNPLFDDLAGIVPKANTVEELVVCMRALLCDKEVRQDIVKTQFEFIKDKIWNSIAAKHIEAYYSVLGKQIRIPVKPLEMSIVQDGASDSTTEEKTDALEMELEAAKKKVSELTEQIKAGSRKKLAIIAPFGINCGIATYTNYLQAELKKYFKIKIFAEYTKGCNKDRTDVIECWTRNTPYEELVAHLAVFQPDTILIQHEYGTMNDARTWISLINQCKSIAKTVVVLHGIYNHPEKIFFEAVCSDIVVHSESAKQVLLEKGIAANIHIIPHGCVPLANRKNIITKPFGTASRIISQFGFGFHYKGFDTAIKTTAILKEKYPDVFYYAQFNTSAPALELHKKLYDELQSLIKTCRVENNFALNWGYLSETALLNILMCSKIICMPYWNHPDWKVYGASGAGRFALQADVPVIYGNVPFFDELKGYCPLINNEQELADEISKHFDDTTGEYRADCLKRQRNFVNARTWDKTAQKFYEILI